MKEIKNKILVVEDEPATLKAIVEKLTTSGFEVLEAANGEKGLTIAEEERPDLILLDVLMPKMDGMMMMSKLRETEWGKSVPIIVLTNLAADDKITAGVVMDEPAYYLMKTEWPLNEVVQKIRSVLN